MNPMIAFGTAATAFLALDALWLGVVAREFYYSRLGPLMKDPPDLHAAAAFYALYVAGIVYFAILPALAAASAGRALINGALFGLVAYATYDLTNLATLRGFPAELARIDIAWGAFATAIAAGAGYLAVRKFGG
jgi:uncharacterized membrane protein